MGLTDSWEMAKNLAGSWDSSTIITVDVRDPRGFILNLIQLAELYEFTLARWSVARASPPAPLKTESFRL